MPIRKPLPTVIELSSGSDEEDDSIIIGSPMVKKALVSCLSKSEIEKRAQQVSNLTVQYGDEDCGWGVKTTVTEIAGQQVVKSLSVSVIPRITHTPADSRKDIFLVILAGPDCTEADPLVRIPFSAFPAVRVRVDFSQISNEASFSLSCPWLVKSFTKRLNNEMQKISERAGGGNIGLAVQWLESSGIAYLDIVRNHSICYVSPVISHKKASYIIFEDPESVIPFYEKMRLKYQSLEGTVLSLETTFDCSICYDHKPAMAAVLFPGCKHFFCRECVTKDLSLKIVDGQVKDLTCLAQNCKSLADIDMMKQLVDKVSFRRYCEMMSEDFVDGSKMIIRCPKKECSAPMELTPNLPREVRCMTCRHSFCTSCKADPHRGSPCLSQEQKKKIRTEWNAADATGRETLKKRYGSDNVRFALEDADSEEWIGKNTKSCPKCATPIEKNDGCNKIICTAKGCGAFFCWLCGVILEPPNPYFHFRPESGSTCAGLLYQGGGGGAAVPVPHPVNAMQRNIFINRGAVRNAAPRAVVPIQYHGGYAAARQRAFAARTVAQIEQLQRHLAEL